MTLSRYNLITLTTPHERNKHTFKRMKTNKKIRDGFLLLLAIFFNSSGTAQNLNSWNTSVGVRFYSTPKLDRRVDGFKFKPGIAPELSLGYSRQLEVIPISIHLGIGLSAYPMRYKFELNVPKENEFYGEQNTFDLKESFLLSPIRFLRLDFSYNLKEISCGSGENSTIGLRAYLGMEINEVGDFGVTTRLRYKHVNQPSVEGVQILSKNVILEKSRYCFSPTIQFSIVKCIKNRHHELRIASNISSEDIGVGHVLVTASPIMSEGTFKGKTLYFAIRYAIGFSKWKN